MRRLDWVVGVLSRVAAGSTSWLQESPLEDDEDEEEVESDRLWGDTPFISCGC